LTIMNCQDYQKQLKSFFEDLLTEKEYQEVCTHLDACAACRQYVSSTGSLSYLLKELGEMDVPKDLLTTVHFRLDKKESDQTENVSLHEEPSSSLPRIMIIIVIAGIAVSLTGLFMLRGVFDSSKLIIEEKIEDKNAPAVEAKTIDESENNIPPLKDQSPDSNKILAQNAIPESFSLHWHIPYSKEFEMKQLVKTIKILEIKPDYEDNDFLIFQSTGEQLKLLIDGIQFNSELELDLPNFILEGNFPDREIPVSIFFMGQTSLIAEMPSIPVIEKNGVFVAQGSMDSLSENVLDWHVLMISSQRDTLFNVIRQGGGTIIYTSKEAAIFSISHAKISVLTENIQDIGGVFTDFGDVELSEDSSVKKTEKVLIHFKYQ